MRISVDLAASRRGQRHELAATTRARFGRHPDCEVSFDAHRDIDASSRHAELRPAERAWVLVDLGSSNGTFVDGQRVTELAVVAGIAHTIEFGPGGPRVRLFIGEESGVAPLGQCSVVTAPYGVDGRVLGVLGVIGPTRMAYDRVIPMVQATASVLGAALNRAGQSQ